VQPDKLIAKPLGGKVAGIYRRSRRRRSLGPS
jgi:hypothetical protein